MKWEIVLWATFIVVGIVASFWNFGHLFFTAIPSSILCLMASCEYRQEKRKRESAPHLKSKS